MCIMRSLFTCQRDIGINTEKPDLTYMFCTKTENDEENTSISSFCCFPKSIRKVCIAQSLFSLLKVWPGVSGEPLVKWTDMQDRQQQKKLRSLRKWKDVLKVEPGVPGELLVKWIKISSWHNGQENDFIDEHYQYRQQRKAETFKKVKRSKET